MSEVIPTQTEVEFDGKNMICDTNNEGVIEFGNRRFFEMTGYEKSELLGKNINLLRHPDMPECFFQKMWHSVKSGEDWKGYIKNLRKDGSYFWSVIYITPTEKGFSALYKKAERIAIDDIMQKYQTVLALEKQGTAESELKIANLACEDIVR